MATQTMPSLTVGDDAFDRGVRHGAQFAQQIADNIGSYLRRFSVSGLSREDVLREGAAWLDAIGRHNADYHAEMVGIARGCGASETEIAVLNARYEIAFTLFGQDAQKQENLLSVGPDGCSTFGLLPEATADGHTWLGQNWDWLEAIHGRTLILRVRREHAPSYICLTEAGIVGGKMAVNECGIGLVENGLACTDDGLNPYQKPFHVRCREIAEASRYEDALRPIVGTPRTCSANFVVGHSDGEIIGLEASPRAVSCLYPVDGIVTHSNHFMGDGHGESLMERISPNTLYRAARLRRLLARTSGQITFEDMQDAVRDRFGAPNGICREPDPRTPNAKRSMTIAAVLINLTGRVIHVANGPPSEHQFEPFSIDGPE